VAHARGFEAGGITSLVAVIERDGEALDADLQAQYGLSLNDLAAGRLTFRRLRGLIASLPPDGTALWRAQRREFENADTPLNVVEPGSEWWTPERDLLALVADLLSLQIWQASGAKGSRPKPISRPGSGERKARQTGGRVLTVADIAEILRDEVERPSGTGLDEGGEEAHVEDGPAGAEDDSEDGQDGAAQVVALGGDEAGDAQGQAEDSEADE
jgi:hypothetical protein